jgi:hypothetical protein
VPAHSARAFGDSVGVNVHIGFSDTPAYSSYGAVEARLRELGVRYVRDGLCATCTEWIQRLERLAAAGIRSNIIAGNLTGTPSTLAQNLQAIRSRLRNAVVSLEAPNEPDQTGDPQWVAKTRAFQQDLYLRVKGDPALAHLPVLGPALVHPLSWPALGSLTSVLDRGNMHPYPGGGTPLHNLGELLPLAANTSGSEPIVATEAGYHSDLTTTSGHYGTSERAIAIYTPRLALEGFRRGLERTYIYQLADMWPESQRPSNVAPFDNAFGLLRSNLSPKPSFLALRNLLRAVDADSAPVAAPGGLRLALEGAGPEVRQLLLASADGSYALVLWREVSVWNRVARQDQVPAPSPLNVIVGQPIAIAQRFDPVESDLERGRWIAPQRIPVELGGSPVVVRLVPPGTPAGGSLGIGPRPTRCGERLGRASKRPPKGKRRIRCCRRAGPVAKRKRSKHAAGRRARGRRRAKWVAVPCRTVRR